MLVFLLHAQHRPLIRKPFWLTFAQSPTHFFQGTLTVFVSSLLRFTFSSRNIREIFKRFYTDCFEETGNTLKRSSISLKTLLLVKGKEFKSPPKAWRRGCLSDKTCKAVKVLHFTTLFPEPPQL